MEKERIKKFNWVSVGVIHNSQSGDKDQVQTDVIMFGNAVAVRVLRERGGLGVTL